MMYNPLPSARLTPFGTPGPSIVPPPLTGSLGGFSYVPGQSLMGTYSSLPSLGAVPGYGFGSPGYGMTAQGPLLGAPSVGAYGQAYRGPVVSRAPSLKASP